MSSPRAPSPSLSDLETRKQLLLAELEDGESSIDTLQKAAASGTLRSSISTLGKVKAVDLGTPVLQASSPYSCLPNPDKFSHDICDVINFENLPDSTGKYEKMSDLIRKVRTVVTRIQQEDDDDSCEGSWK
jgi:zinc finger CCHC domain-containing protein 8